MGTGASISLDACPHDLVDLLLVANLTDASQRSRSALAALLTQEVQYVHIRALSSSLTAPAAHMRVCSG
jgi:hypothetical protein